MNEAAIWHELECWGYDADVPMWHELAAEFGAPVVDLGAGTGRVSLDLAAAGHEVVAVDLDPHLLSEIAVHGPDLPIRTVAADIRTIELEPAPLVIVPMQTVQLLGGPDGRAAMLAAVRRIVAPAGALAVAIAEDVEPYEADEPLPFVACERDGVHFSSDPFAITADGDGYLLHHARMRRAPDGTSTATVNLTRLDRLDAETFEAEGAQAGFTVLARRFIGPTDAHVGSAVVMLGG